MQESIVITPKFLFLPRIRPFAPDILDGYKIFTVLLEEIEGTAEHLVHNIIKVNAWYGEKMYFKWDAV